MVAFDEICGGGCRVWRSRGGKSWRGDDGRCGKVGGDEVMDVMEGVFGGIENGRR